MKCFGRLPAKNAPCLKYKTYKTATPMQIPTAVNWVSNKITNWEIAGNDRYGDCVLAAKYHELKSWIMDESGQPFEVAEGDIVKEYFKLTGGRDSGLNLQDVLDTWKSEGLFGHKIDGYVSVDPKNLQEVKEAIYLFGCVDIGISVMSQFEQVAAGGVWTATSGRSIGGHGIPLLGYDDRKGQFALCSWGEIYYMTYACFNFVCDEVYGPLSTDWCGKNKAPNSFNCTQLSADLASL